MEVELFFNTGKDEPKIHKVKCDGYEMKPGWFTIWQQEKKPLPHGWDPKRPQPMVRRSTSWPTDHLVQINVTGEEIWETK